MSYSEKLVPHKAILEATEKRLAVICRASFLEQLVTIDPLSLEASLRTYRMIGSTQELPSLTYTGAISPDKHVYFRDEPIHSIELGSRLMFSQFDRSRLSQPVAAIYLPSTYISTDAKY